jgi:hypothetical protein
MNFRGCTRPVLWVEKREREREREREKEREREREREIDIFSPSVHSIRSCA